MWYIEQNNPRTINHNDICKDLILGPEYLQKEIEEQLDTAGAKYEIFKDEELLDKTATDLSNEEAIGWFQGRMEFGPRALGGRSILGDPRSEKMQKNLNLKVNLEKVFVPLHHQY